MVEPNTIHILSLVERWDSGDKSVMDEDDIQVSVLCQQLIMDGQFLLQELLLNEIVRAKGIAKLQRKIVKEISVLTKVRASLVTLPQGPVVHFVKSLKQYLH